MTQGGTRVSAETSRRLACEASRVVMRHDEDGRIVEVGARTRTLPPALRRGCTTGTGAAASVAAGVRWPRGNGGRSRRAESPFPNGGATGKINSIESRSPP
ncbi:MAG: hypothetical protein DMD83_10065 [Candidatus Rokuibacteriota bacterium]|nr:MAG: hypothetical protein DMD83_10065 [Candidatus Rokubacteria bacterium]